MDNSLQKKLLTRLDALAEKLGTSGEYLFEVLLRQAEVEVYKNAALFGLLLLISIGLSFSAYRFLKEENYDGGGPLTAVAVLFFIFTAVVFSRLLTPLLNPEYWALREILQQIGR